MAQYSKHCWACKFRPLPLACVSDSDSVSDSDIAYSYQCAVAGKLMAAAACIMSWGQIFLILACTRGLYSFSSYICSQRSWSLDANVNMHRDVNIGIVVSSEIEAIHYININIKVHMCKNKSTRQQAQWGTVIWVHRDTIDGVCMHSHTVVTSISCSPHWVN